MVLIFSTPLNFGLDSSWEHITTHNVKNKTKQELEIMPALCHVVVHFSDTSEQKKKKKNPVWLLFKKQNKKTVGVFPLSTLLYYPCESLPHQSRLWSRWEAGDTPILPYWHQTRCKTLWSLGWRRTSHTPTHMTDDKGPDNKQEEDTSWRCCID